MTQPTQKGLQKLSFVLSYILSIRRTGKLPHKSKFNCTKSNIDYWARKLRKANIIKRVDKVAGLYEVVKTDKEIKEIYTKEFIVTTKTPTKNSSLKYKRVHSFQYKVNLPNFDYWYKILPNYLKKKGIQFHKNKKNQYRVEMIFNNKRHIFLLCKDSILSYLPTGTEFISDNVDYACELAKPHIREVLDKFSTYFGKDLRIKGDFDFTITRRHIAMMNNEIAQNMHKKKKELKVYVNGKLRIITDKSFNFDELEAITLDKGKSDVKSMEKMIKDVIEYDHTISDVKLSLEEKIARQEALIERLVNTQGKLLRYVEEKEGNFNTFKY